MPAFPTYSTGTVSVSAGATVIVGNGTIWSGVNARPGDDIVIGGHTVVIQDVTDVTHLVIDPWPFDAVAAGTAYKIIQRSPLRYAGAQAMADVSKLVAALNADGFYVFVAPGQTEPDPSYGEDGQYAFQAQTGKLWEKVGGVWSFVGSYSGISFRGAYNPATAYHVNDVLTSGGSTYIVTADATGNAPPNASYYSLLAPKGDTGTAATVAVGTTTTGAAGTNASVINSGTPAAAVLNFTIPTGKGYGGTSTTSLAIGTGAKTFATQAGLAYQVGARVRVSSSASPSNYMEGIVTSYSGSSLVASVDYVAGTGTFAAWNINLTADKGTGTGDMLAANNLSEVADKDLSQRNVGLGEVRRRQVLTAIEASKQAMHGHRLPSGVADGFGDVDGIYAGTNYALDYAARLIKPSGGNMDVKLFSKQPFDVMPLKMRATLLIDPVDQITLDTDLLVSVSRDAVIWTSAPINVIATLGNGYYAESDLIDVRGQGIAVTPGCRVQTANGKNVAVRGYALTWSEFAASDVTDAGPVVFGDAVNGAYFHSQHGLFSDLPSYISGVGGTFTRASAQVLANSAGVYSSFASGVPAVTDLGYLSEPAGTNNVRNPRAVGAVAGSPGTLPTNWVISGLPSGISSSVAGVGTANGIDYVDITIAGTPAASATGTLSLEAGTVIAAASGQTWTLSSFLAVVGGSLANIGISLELREVNSSGAFLTNSTAPVTPGATLDRMPPLTRALNNASTAFVQPRLDFAFTSGQAVNLTLRAAWPQVEQSAFATSPILPPAGTIATSTRAATALSLLVPAMSSYTMFAEAVPLSPTTNPSDQTLIQLDSGSSAQRTLVRRSSATGNLATFVVGGTGGAPSGIGSWAQNDVGRIGFAVDTAGARACFDGGTVRSGTITALPAPPTTVRVGMETNGLQFSGLIRSFAVFPIAKSAAQLQALTS